MGDSSRGGGPSPTFETPLLSSRPLQSAAATASRLPLGRPSTSAATFGGEPRPASGVTMTAGRLPILRRPSSAAGRPIIPATASKLPTRRPSVSGLRDAYVDHGALTTPSTSRIPGTASRTMGTLKRTSSVAELAQDTELTTTKRQLSRAQHELADLQHTQARQLLEASSAQASFQSQLAEYASRTERLERHRATLIAKERELLEREQERVRASDALRGELQSEARTLREELSTLRDKNAELGASWRDLQHEAAQDRAAREADRIRADGLEKELDRERAETALRRSEAMKEGERRREVELELERLKAEQRDTANADVIREELHRQVDHLRALEKENGKLKRKVETFEKEHVNIEILREANKTFEKKVRTLDVLRKHAAAKEEEVEALKREKAEWLSFLGPPETAEFSTPRQVTKTLAAARIENASYREKLDSQALEVQHRDRLIGEVEARMDDLETELAGAKVALRKAEARATQEESRHKLLVQEVAMLKRHLETYNTEEAHSMTGNFDEQKTARLSELEALLDAHKLQVADLSKEAAHYRGLAERSGGSNDDMAKPEERSSTPGADDTAVIVGRSLEEQLRRNEAIQDELVRYKNENALMVKEIEALELQNDRLTYEHNNGAYDPRTTKVLELRDSPDRMEHAVRTATLERLREENKALLDKLRELESRKAAGPDKGAATELMVPRQSYVNLEAEMEVLRGVVKQKETMELRLKQAFSDKADEFRKAVYSLLGYRLDFLSSGRVKVSSTYGAKDDSLLFNSSPGGEGTMELVGAGSEKGKLSDEVRRQIQFWVRDRESIPGFLASLTLTLFEETTRGRF